VEEEREGGWWPRFDRDVLVGSMAENARRSFWSEWERLVCPALVVLAENSLIPAGKVDAMLRRRPATRAVSIPGTGHDPHLEWPEAPHAVLGDFVGSGA
jgi:pimeloyl-ACP methyl ester carboxylesterase